MLSKIERNRNSADQIPEQYAAWQLFGAGMENVGKDGKPVTLPLREPSENEILLRVDALGLCQSDLKIIQQGSKHARLRGRDLSTEPTVLGHECAATVVKVGKRWKDKFHAGERYIVQADIYYKGLGYAFGYLIPGGLAQYCYLDERALDGDEGCYLLPVRPETGYSQSALAEPWACVEMSYNLDDRRAPGTGRMLIVTDQPSAWAKSYPDALVATRLATQFPEAEFDDVIAESPTPGIVNLLAPRLRKNGVMYLLGTPAEAGAAALDIGRIHYEGVRFFGGATDLQTLAERHARHDLLPGGDALFIGAGGPMGQMHVQRALEVKNRPRRVVVTDLDRGRLDHIQKRFHDLAEQNGVELLTFAPSQFANQQAMDAHVRSLTPGGYSDVIILAPAAAVVSYGAGMAADFALINIFAGVGIGNVAAVSLHDLCRGVKLIGSSGSRISDLRKVLEMVESRQLNTNFSVAAVGGLNAAKQGIEALRDARFPGKTVIYPQIPELPLMAVEDVPEHVPELRGKLGPQNSWTQEAEATLLEKFAAPKQ
ncbi:MAG: alcohol dehydrogenase catalytic domain-containing protein [Candidatus Hydrogenedentes bacterium]|nr:alcohol dehydrogenase catalytic domain-containing protein [Candidatus Hydrogenedentota bacterium]